MKKMLVAIILFLATAQVASGQEWTRVWPTDCRCFISAPAKFNVTKETTNERFIGSITFTMLETRVGEVLYGLAWVDYHEPMKLTIEGELKANRDNFLRQMGGRHIKTIPITLREKRGIHFTGEAGTSLITSRVYVVGQRAYMLFVLTRKRENRAKEIERFLSSFDFSPTR